MNAMGSPYPYTTRTTCRCCSSKNLTPLFSLGDQYVSDFVDGPPVLGGVYPPRVPIDIELCRDCTLVQAKHTAPQELLYSRHYWYRSGVTQTMRDALRDVVEAARERVQLATGDVVLDIGSNDGTLLRNYPDHIYKIGIEPAENLHYEGKRGIDLLVRDFWSAETYHAAVALWDNAYLAQQPKIITACGMLYDLEDPNQFIADVAKVLHPDGLFIAQLTCLKQTVDNNDVGNFCHEHLEFYSLRSLETLLQKHGLQIVDVEDNLVNGGSYRLFIKHGTVSERCSALSYFIKFERDFGDPDFYASWFDALTIEKARCVSFIKDAVAAGKKVWVYGASTKGNVVLQWLSLDDKLIVAAADRSPEKWGKYTVGTNIPITSEEEFRLARPDYALVLPYAFLPEFLEREKTWLANGGKFLVPLPHFKVV